MQITIAPDDLYTLACYALGMIVGFGIGKIFFNIWKNVSRTLKNKKLYKKNMKKVEELKASGEYHNWISVIFDGKPLYVCAKTGYCPTIDGFISKAELDTIIKFQQYKQDYIEFKIKRFAEISEKYGLDLDKFALASKEVEEIANEFAKNRKEMEDVKRPC